MFIDSAFGAPFVERLRNMGHKNVHEIRFGGPSPDVHTLNMRAFMWSRLRDWLRSGMIDSKDERLEADLSGPGYKINATDKLVLESKEDMAKRGVTSPDDADALALTFAAAVGVGRRARPTGDFAYTPTEYAW